MTWQHRWVTKKCKAPCLCLEKKFNHSHSRLCLLRKFLPTPFRDRTHPNAWFYHLFQFPSVKPPLPDYPWILQHFEPLSEHFTRPQPEILIEFLSELRFLLFIYLLLNVFISEMLYTLLLNFLQLFSSTCSINSSPSTYPWQLLVSTREPTLRRTILQHDHWEQHTLPSTLLSTCSRTHALRACRRFQAVQFPAIGYCEGTTMTGVNFGNSWNPRAGEQWTCYPELTKQIKVPDERWRDRVWRAQESIQLLLSRILGCKISASLKLKRNSRLFVLCPSRCRSYQLLPVLLLIR